MSQRWLKLLETLGSPLRSKPPLKDALSTGQIRQGLWHEFRHYDLLFQLYGPPKGSPFAPYHCPTLFAAVDRLALQPRLTELSPEVTEPKPEGAWQWLGPDTFVLIDLPGALSVQLGARLLIEGGAQLISAFDHWPAANPMRRFTEASYVNMAARPWPPQQVRTDVAIDSRDVLDSMISLAPQVWRRTQQGIAPDAPAVLLCDSRRTVAAKAGPGDYDNRYYIDDSILPGEALLRRLGIRKLVFFGLSEATAPSADLTVFMNECARGGISLHNATLDQPETWAVPLPMRRPVEVRLSSLAFPKSQVGGFGRRIPVPSESSGGSFSGAGG
jgi:hypothetical protein